MYHRRICLVHATKTAFHDWRGVCEQHSGNTSISFGHILSAIAAMFASLTHLEELLGLLLLLLLKGREQKQREKWGHHETEVAVSLVTWRFL